MGTQRKIVGWLWIVLLSGVLCGGLGVHPGVAGAQIVLNSPATGSSLTSAPTFSWTGGPQYYGYTFLSIFFYDTGSWSGYYIATTNLATPGFAMPQAWWDKLGYNKACVWAVSGQNMWTGQRTWSSAAYFTKVPMVGEMAEIP